MKRYSVRNLEQIAIDTLADIKANERREFGAILEDCIISYWNDNYATSEDDIHASDQNRTCVHSP